MNNLNSILPRIEAADPDRLRASKLADAGGRTNLAWIYAFHLELAKVPELVSETMIGEIRYRWWRDVVGEIYSGGSVRAHEVTTPLSKVLIENDIPRFWVDRLIDGRNRDLDPAPFVNMEEAIIYCEMTSGTLMQIAARSLSNVSDESVFLAAGKAWGLTGLARAYPYYHDRILSKLSFADIISAAQQAYDEAKTMTIAPDALPACAYASLVPHYLKKMQGVTFDPKETRVSLSPIAKQLRQFQTVIKGRL